MITVPESVDFYRADAANRAALDVLMDADGVPGDLTLPEAERFELAALAAKRVRVEHWTLLRALWTATWGEAVRIHLPAARLLSYGEHSAFAAEVDAYAEPSADAAWENEGICGVLTVPGAGRLFTAFWLIEGATEAQLQFYIISDDGNCATSEGLDLGSDWTDDGEGRRETVADRLPFATTPAGIDPEPIAELARGAIARLAGALA